MRSYPAWLRQASSEYGAILFRRLHPFNLTSLHPALLLTPYAKSCNGNSEPVPQVRAFAPLQPAEKTYALLVGKKLLHYDVHMRFMQIPLTSG